MADCTKIETLRVLYAGRPRSWARTAIHNGRRLTPKALRLYKRSVTKVMQLACSKKPNWPSSCSSSRFSVAIHFRLPDRRRCDIDNLAKAVLDAGNKIAWHDDCQIDQLTLTKTHRNDNPGFEMLVQVCND